MILAVCSAASIASAERNVLAPTGTIASPDSVQLRYMWGTSGRADRLGWLTIGSPVADLPLELEIGNHDVEPWHTGTLGLQYLVTTEAFSDIAPVLSVGVRDVLNSPAEGRAAYMALTKAVGLSRGQERVVSSLRLHGGYGTGPMGGAYIGVQARFAAGFTAQAELLNRRFNAGVSLPVGRAFSVRAFSLDGDLFVGGVLSLRR